MLGGRWGVIKNVLVKMVMEKMRLTEPFSFSGKGLKGDGSGGIQLLLSIAIPLVAFYQVCVKYRPPCPALPYKRKGREFAPPAL